MRPWIALVKFRYHVTFSSVLCGALLFAPRIDQTLVIRLVLLYLCFNVLLYGGIYTLNDVADRHADARHPGKRFRPVAAGSVSVKAATVFGSALIGAGLIIGILVFPPSVLACFVAALGFNACYSLFARNCCYLDIVFNSITHPNRFLMGALLAGRMPPTSHLVAVMLLALALSCLRRAVERDAEGWQARRTIAAYGAAELETLAAGCLGVLGLVTAIYSGAAPGFYLIVGTTAAVTAIGGWMDSPVRVGLRTIWTR